MPAAAVPSLADAQVVTEYCIGAAGPVRTVVLLSNEPIEKARRVFLDAHSLTSVQLAGYLLAKHWKVTPNTIRSKIMRSWGTPCRATPFC